MITQVLQTCVPFAMVTQEARDVFVLMVMVTEQDGRRETTPLDLAVALLQCPGGNIAAIRRGGIQEAFEKGPTDVRFARETRELLEAAYRIALLGREPNLGTHHLAAAVVRHGPPEAVERLGEAGVTAEAVDRLLAELAGGMGAERLVAPLTRRERRAWNRSAQPGAITVGLAAAIALALVVGCVGLSFF
ncbi:hypothetical protein ABZS66_36450 [Dactylosporangium sp. NPDC005572]|uniref:hypothetical protein n=1 Tax=Dactylosporangium sp. NPDC005572 TaxID=3156889 RepID=UPI0033B8F751